ncbi:hypothetical protein QTJ16_000487 [Diplocarpon rosae]|uniref:Uncharacterized protein n=1 Tax=Diplocarpon rosae TaxID=946125 RepID=A0AAD9T612_9HELO|nr:hypothetical protein QTJ16_000487 [Diplocarpon rosae]
MGEHNASLESGWTMSGGGSPRRRDSEDPVSQFRRVSGETQAKPVDGNAARFLFEFDQQQRHGHLPDRPSTSAGSAFNSARTRTTGKPRDTQDDLHLDLHANGLETTFYNFPLPGSLPTPTGSPKSLPLPSSRKLPSTALPTRPPTPASLELQPANGMGPQPQEIGMALGSPQHPPTAWPTHLAGDRYTATPDHVGDEFTNLPSTTKQKPSKWKRFFGSKKPEVHPPPLYQLHFDPTQQSASRGSGSGPGTVTNEKQPKSSGRTRSTSIRRNLKHKATMSRSQTEPVRPHVEAKCHKPPPTNPDLIFGGGRVDGDGPRPTPKGFGLLDVDIPSVQLERYSIMFGSLLEKPESLQSSLLARRQATLEKLKTVNAELDVKVRTSTSHARTPKDTNGGEKDPEEGVKAHSPLPRRATSPGMALRNQSPSFSLFPQTPHTAPSSAASPLGPRGATPIQRSNTSPAVLSPARPSFAPKIDNEDHANLVEPDSPTIPRRRQPDAAQELRPSKPKMDGPRPVGETSTASIPRGQDWSEQSHLVLDSPSKDQSDDARRRTPNPEPIAVAIPMGPTMPEPRWHAPPRSVSQTLDKSGSDSSTGSSTSTSTSVSSITTPLSQSTAPYPVVKPLRLRAPSASQTWRPAATRARSATTVAAPSAIPRLSSQTATPLPPSAPKLSSPTSDEDEARLETAADVSIARQISVSRRQRQLLVPIKTSVRARGQQNPGGGGARGLSPEERAGAGPGVPTADAEAGPISVGPVSSPLGAIATASKEEIERFSPPAEKGELRASAVSPNTERLVQGFARPRTPTLVVVGRGADERERAWAGATARSTPRQPSPMGVSEGRRLRQVSQPGHAPQHSMVGEIRVGMAVSREGSTTRKANVSELKYRKSERAVVERVRVRN